MELIRQHFATLDSTNTWGKDHLGEFARDKITLITADVQTKGRGQFNRPWISPPNTNIYATFCFFMEQGRTDIVNIPQLLAIAVVDVLAKMNIQAQIKWPNDLMLSGKKFGGILCETTPVDDQLGVVLGIGINLNMELEWLNKIDQPATSLNLNKKILFDELIMQFQKHLFVYLEKGFTPFAETLQQYLIPVDFLH